MKSLRAKVAAYLLSEAARAHSLTFSIPFSRIQLADYLNCDRSALSRELSTMQKEGSSTPTAAASSCWSRMPCSRWCNKTLSGASRQLPRGGSFMQVFRTVCLLRQKSKCSPLPRKAPPFGGAGIAQR